MKQLSYWLGLYGILALCMVGSCNGIVGAADWVKDTPTERAFLYGLRVGASTSAMICIVMMHLLYRSLSRSLARVLREAGTAASRPTD